MSKKSKKIRGKSRFFIYYILILVVVFFVGYKAKELSKDMEFFNIKNIRITGNNLVSKEYLSSIADEYIGVNIFELDKNEMAERFKTISRIEDINTVRLLPSRLLVRVKERIGVFYIKENNGEIHPIDEQRVILDKADWYVEEDLPLININFSKDKIGVGQKLDDTRIEYIFEVYDILKKNNPSIISDISEFYFIRNDLYFIDIKSGSRVILSTSDIAEQMSRFLFLRNNQGFNRHSTIDLRFGEQIVVTNN